MQRQMKPRRHGDTEAPPCLRVSVVIFLSLAAVGCTVHPDGENQERQSALHAGAPYEPPIAQRQLPPLPDKPTVDDLVRYALQTNPDVERSYWEWRSALEQIPIDGTQATNLAISAGTILNRGSFSGDRTTIGAQNDPMSDIVLPDKLSAAAHRSLEAARAAAKRFRQAQLDLRSKVISAYDDYALTAEMIRLGNQSVQLLQATASITEARNRAASSSQQDVLKSRNELDLARNNVANLQSQLPAQLAALNALLGREASAPIAPPAALPPARPVQYSDQQLLDLLAKANPQLLALADEIRGKQQSIRLAKLQYIPDFSLSANTDLAGMAQNLSGMITLPLLRHEALDAAIAQAKANLRASEAARRRTKSDLAAQAIMDIATLRDADRQLQLFEQAILPRSRQEVALTRAAYESATATLLDLLDSQRSLIDTEQLVVTLRITRDKRLADLESLAAAPIQPAP